MRWLNSRLGLTAAGRGSLPPRLRCLWCLCSCTGSGSRLFICEKTDLTEKVTRFLSRWRAALVHPYCQRGIQWWHWGTGREQSCKEGAAGTQPCGPGQLLDGLSLAMSLALMSVPLKLYCLVPYQQHLVSVCVS